MTYFLSSSSLWLERATHALATALEYLRIDHGGLDVLVPQEFLHRANIIVVFQKVGSKAMAEGVDRGVLLDAALFEGCPEGILYRGGCLV